MMPKVLIYIKFCIFVTFVSLSFNRLIAQNCDKWIFGYVPTYTQHSFNGSIDYMEASDFAKVTHIGHLGPYVNSNGSLNMTSNGATNIRLERGVQDAHDNGVPILLSFQAWYTDYLPALANLDSRASLINNVLFLLDHHQYDGVDVDLEPIMSPWVDGIQNGNPNYIAFINTLYDSLQTRICPFTNQKPILAVAANGYAGPVMNQLEDKFDMINLLTYDLAGVFPGWVTWHDSPVFDGGNIMPSTGQPMPSVHGEVMQCINAGVSPSKLGVGVSMDAFRWQGGDGTPTGGVTAPMQAYNIDPTWTRMSYREFIQNHYSSNHYEYDSDAKMSYLSKDNPGSSQDEFWSYNDIYSCIDKVDYVWDNNLGGSMIWELKSGYLPSNPSNSRIPQLNFIYDQNCLRYTVLPLEYVESPNCHRFNDNNYLEWATGVEINVADFEISGYDKFINEWILLKKIPAKGQASLYSINVEKDVSNNIERYKICSKDYNGAISNCKYCECFKDNYEYEIYPNPLSSVINISYGQDEVGYLTLYDQTGKIHFTGELMSRLDLSFLNKGIYFLKLIGSRDAKTFKLIKTNE